VRDPEESVVAYVACLKSLAEYCEFGTTLEAMIRDRIVCGINDSRIQSRLLQEKALTYQMAFDTAQAMESASKDISDLQKKVAPTQAIQLLPGRHGKHAGIPTHTSPPFRVFCYRCGGAHYATKCKFIDAECRACHKRGHIAIVCKSKTKYRGQQAADHSRPSGGKTVPPYKGASQTNHIYTGGTYPTTDNTSCTSDLNNYPLFTLPGEGGPIVVMIHVNNIPLQMEVDTGASLSIISEETYKSVVNYLGHHLQMLPYSHIQESNSTH
jgi:hypothetical protein